MKTLKTYTYDQYSGANPCYASGFAMALLDRGAGVAQHRDEYGGSYGYSSANQRIRVTITTDVFAWFYGFEGEMLAVYKLEKEGGDANKTWPVLQTARERVYALGRLIRMGTNDVVVDRGASVIRHGSSNLAYYPCGEEQGGATANDRAKFATYTRDASTDLDYAWNRMYKTEWGRFTSADPWAGSGRTADPATWNRYSYVSGDPVNFMDPSGYASTKSAEMGEFMSCTRWDPVGGFSWMCELEGGRYHGGDGGGTGGGVGGGELSQAVVDWGQAQIALDRSRQAQLNIATDAAVDALEEKQGCRQLFGSGADPARMLRNVRDGSTSGPPTSMGFESLERTPGQPRADAEVRYAPQTYEPITNTWNTPSASIIINSEGSWDGRWGGSRNLYGNYTDGQFRMLLVLHELLHVYEVVAGLGGIQSGLTHETFDQKIVDNCIK